MFLFVFGFPETMEVYYKSDTPIAGFQFNVGGVTLTNASEGDAEKYVFDIFFDSNTTLTTPILGFSLTGSTIPAGNGILLVLDVDGNTDDVCLTDVIISDSDGQTLDVTVEDCNSIIINEIGNTSSREFAEDGSNCPSEAASGDINADGTSDVLDIVQIVNVILGNDFVDECAAAAADINGDSNADIQDIVQIVSPILGYSDLVDATSGKLIRSNNALILEANGFIGGVQMTLKHSIDFSIELTDKAMVADYRTVGNETKLVIVTPEVEQLFTYIGDFEIVDMIISNSDGRINVEVPPAFRFSESYPESLGDIENKFYNTSWAVIIGINEYENIKSLSYAVQDAREIRDLLISNFGFPKDNIKLLTDKEATLTNIKDDLYEIADKANEEDRILVYFAGHGETRSLKSGGDKGYLIPADGNIDKIFTTCLPMTEIKEIANITVAKHVLFLMDACFSGLATVNTRGLDRSTPGYIEKIARDQARQIITAGGKKDKVIEKNEWGHSAFAKNLIQGLKSAVADQDYDGYITADELGSYLKKRVYIDSDNQQTPLKARFGSGEGEFVFLARKIIESSIIGIIPNVWEKDQTPSIRADLLTVEDIHLLYGENEIVKKLFEEIAELKERLAQGIQFIYGCKDESAINYNPNANLDDESCVILDSDDVYIRFGDFHNRDSTLDVFMASKRRIYNLEFFTEGFEIVDVLDGILGLDNIKTSFNLEEIYVEFSDSLDGYVIPKEEILLFKAKILPIEEAFCFTGLTINEHDTTNVLLGECKIGLIVQKMAIVDTTEIEILSGEYATETGSILQETEEGKFDILLEDSTIVYDVDPSEVKGLEEQIYSGNYFYIKNVDYSDNTIEIYYQSDTPIAGFQFNGDGIEITDASGGNAQTAGFMMSSSSTTTLGFSLTGSTIPAGEGTLLFLGYIEQSSAICISGLVVSDSRGNAMDFQAGECWVH